VRKLLPAIVILGGVPKGPRRPRAVGRNLVVSRFDLLVLSPSLDVVARHAEGSYGTIDGAARGAIFGSSAPRRLGSLAMRKLDLPEASPFREPSIATVGDKTIVLVHLEDDVALTTVR
jgi:hypothetical protein